MAAYDDRPISMYDNLNIPSSTSTPKSKVQPTTSTATTSANGATTNSPYTDISFRFNDNNSQQYKPTQQQQQQHLLPSSNRVLIPNLNQLQPATAIGSSSSSSNYTYATPFKSQATTTTTAPTIAPTTLAQPTAASTNASALTNASPAVRPLSQHSQSDLNEATSQSIAAVKAALHDAKSKFFGLNGYSHNDKNNQSNNNNNNNNSKSELTQNLQNQSQQPLLYDQKNIEHHYSITTAPIRPKVQILTPPPKAQPKYQNIPENSAIFRNLTPPERPPKPIHLKNSNSNVEPTSPTSSSTNNCYTELHSIPATPLSMDMTDRPSTSKGWGNTSYKQIPLNDVECATPSQAVYMSTTVPQNIKGSKIAGRHTPTRNSLRHSRMLVINNKSYQGNDHPNPMHFKCPNLARWMLILQIIIGFFLACLSMWTSIRAPNTAIQDNPYWSALVLLLAGLLGLFLIRFRRIKGQKVQNNCFRFLRADSYVLSLAAVLLCCVALIFAAIHFERLLANDTVCHSSSAYVEQATCLCTFNTPREILEASAKNITFDDENAVWLTKGQQIKEASMDFEDHSYKVEYRDLSCAEVTCQWIPILGVSMSLNGLGLLVSFFYIVLLACYRYDSKHFYTSVQTSTF